VVITDFTTVAYALFIIVAVIVKRVKLELEQEALDQFNLHQLFTHHLPHHQPPHHKCPLRDLHHPYPIHEVNCSFDPKSTKHIDCLINLSCFKVVGHSLKQLD